MKECKQGRKSPEDSENHISVTCCFCTKPKGFLMGLIVCRRCIVLFTYLAVLDMLLFAVRCVTVEMVATTVIRPHCTFDIMCLVPKVVL